MPDDEGTARSPLRMLVVDDDADAAESLAASLRLSGHEVVVATDGVTAVRLAASSRPHVVILDLVMPSLDGHEVARRIRAIASCREALLVAVTGWNARDEQSCRLGADFDEHMSKPIDLEELARVVQRGRVRDIGDS